MESRRNNTWPCPDVPCNLDEVHKFVAQVKSVSATETAFRGTRYVLSVFDVKGETPSVQELYKVLYDTKLIADALDLELFHPSIPWSTNVKDGLGLLSEFLELDAEDHNDWHGMQIAQATRTRYVEPLGRKLPQEKNNQGREAEMYRSDPQQTDPESSPSLRSCQLGNHRDRHHLQEALVFIHGNWGLTTSCPAGIECKLHRLLFVPDIPEQAFRHWRIYVDGSCQFPSRPRIVPH